MLGVVDADLALESSDPRGGERTWALMAQVAGRAGRGEKPGRALIQTYVPDHPLMQALKKGDRDGYLDQEKAIRERAVLGETLTYSEQTEWLDHDADPAWVDPGKPASDKGGNELVYLYLGADENRMAKMREPIPYTLMSAPPRSRATPRPICRRSAGRPRRGPMIWADTARIPPITTT